MTDSHPNRVESAAGEARFNRLLNTLKQAVGAVILFGPPGAGKGTQARGIGRRLGVPHISTGDMLRLQVSAGTSTGRDARAIMEQGALIPDDWVNHMVETRLREPDCRGGFVLDGYPRTRGQAAALDKMLSNNGTQMKVFNIVVGYNEIIRRTTGRRLCPRCGTIYNIYVKPPREPNLCDRDQTPLEIRIDDREDVIRERIQAYEKQTRPVIEYLREQKQAVYEVDGSLPPEKISEQLVEILTAP